MCKAAVAASLPPQSQASGAQSPQAAPTATRTPESPSTQLTLPPPSLQVARWEQKTRRLSRAFGSPYLACYALGGAILLLNVLRSHW